MPDTRSPIKLLSLDNKTGKAVIQVPPTLLDDSNLGPDWLARLITQRESSLAVEKVVDAQQSEVRTNLMILWSWFMESIPPDFSPAPLDKTAVVVDIPGLGGRRFSLVGGYTEKVDPKLLLQAGVSPDVIEAATVRTPKTPYVRVDKWGTDDPGAETGE